MNKYCNTTSDSVVVFQCLSTACPRYSDSMPQAHTHAYIYIYIYIYIEREREKVGCDNSFIFTRMD